MKRSCRWYLENMAACYYGELSDRAALECASHIDTCSQCKQEWLALRETLEMLSQRQRPEPASAFWQQTWTTFLQQKDAGQSAERTATSRWSFHWLIPPAFALAMLLVGFLAGRYFLVSEQEDRALEEQASLHARVQQHLDKSKLIILAFDNLDAQTAVHEGLDFSQEKRVTSQLIQESSYLRYELANSREPDLMELLADLEMILLQISNLDLENTPLQLELVQTGIDRRALLFKLNLEEMKRYRRAEPPKKTI